MNNDAKTPLRIDVDEADALIAAAMPTFSSLRVALEDAVGQTLAERICAERDQPPFNRATMDGIAISAAALTQGLEQFRIAGIQAAGAPQKELPAIDACLEVMTGAVMPDGSDTVIPVERISETDGNAIVENGYTAEPGQFVHPRASDHAENDELMPAGTTIGGPEMAILTAAGKADVAITEWPTVAIVSTGDELVDVGLPLAPHQIRSSNDRAIESALRLHGCNNTRRVRLPDDEDQLLAEIGALHDECGVLILSGGVSMGKYDYVPKVLAQLGVKLVFHKILQRPGLPMWFGVSAAGKPVFALPGNPVSTLVCLTRYVIPALLRSLGSPLRDQRVPLAADISFEPDLCWLLPVRIDYSGGTAIAVPKPTNTSGDFVGLHGTDGFIELPRGKQQFAAGESFRFWPWQNQLR